MTRYIAEGRSESYVCTVGTEKEVQEVRNLIRKHIAAGETVKGYTKKDKFRIESKERVNPPRYDIYMYDRN